MTTPRQPHAAIALSTALVLSLALAAPAHAVDGSQRSLSEVKDALAKCLLSKAR